MRTKKKKRERKKASSLGNEIIKRKGTMAKQCGGKEARNGCDCDGRPLQDAESLFERFALSFASSGPVDAAFSPR